MALHSDVGYRSLVRRIINTFLILQLELSVVSHNLIKQGSRVVCHQLGPYKGARGRVESVFSGQAMVDMGETTIVEPLNCFSKV